VSAFATQIEIYVDSFGVSRTDAARLMAHYPLFRLAHEAAYSSGARRRIARLLARPSYGRTFSHQVQSPRGRFPLTIRFSPDDLASFREIFWGRAYEAAITEASTLVDIGANTGMATCFFSTQYELTRILAVEANEALASTLRANTRSVPSDVEIEMIAISDVDGVTEFAVHENHRHSGIGIEGKSVRRVPTRTLRTLLDEHGLLDVDILKLDVEGAEHRILRQDPGILSRVRCLVMETHLGRAARDQLAQLVQAQGFDVRVDRGAEVDAVTAVRIPQAPSP
jgi:FkbM family methyltransferase